MFWFLHAIHRLDSNPIVISSVFGGTTKMYREIVRAHLLGGVPSIHPVELTQNLRFHFFQMRIQLVRQGDQ